MNKETLTLIGTHISTLIIGALLSWLVMSRKEIKDHRARLQDNSNKLSEELDKRYQAFTSVINRYAQKSEPDGDDFFDISTRGDSYFAQYRTICDYILSDNIDKKSVKNTHLPDIKRVREETLPKYYSTLQEIAKKKNIQYSGVLKKDNYKSIYEVYDKYKLKVT